MGDHSGSEPYGRSGEGMPAFFRVPEGLAHLELLLGRPARVVAPDGSVAVEMSEENMGKVCIPVAGRAGIWSIEPYTHTFRGICPPAFVRLLNVEPLVAFGSPHNLPKSSTRRPLPLASVPAQPTVPLEMTPGVSGDAVRLSGDRSLSFSRGDALPPGGYANLPGAVGTVEFWFRPDWSTQETPLKVYQHVDHPFFHGPHLALDHRYLGRGHERRVWSTVRLQLLAQKAGTPPTGLECRHFFRAGEWVHLAYVWEVGEDAGKMTGTLAIFLNGRRLKPERVRYGLVPHEGRARFELSDEGESVVLGPFGGSMDLLRLSDVVRYHEDFAPSRTPPQMDKHTRALFRFDGSLCGVSAFSEQPTELR